MEDIKNQIKTELEQIHELQDVILEERQRKDPLDYDIPSFPVAFIGAGAITDNDYSDNTSYEVEISHDISVLMKGENVESMTEVEALMYKIALHFMKNSTLGGNCQWIKPTTTEPMVFTHKNRQFIEFTIKLVVRKLVSII